MIGRPRALFAIATSRGIVLAFLLSHAAGCLDHQLEDGAVDGQAQSIALDGDFANFRTWSSQALGTGEHAGLVGNKNVYINRLPPTGASEFPTGTILVKTIEVGMPSAWVAHAMVKRGGTFNANGAFGWEFFDLKLDHATATPSIIWRGEKAPADHGYESLPGVESGSQADCNGCHTSAANDAVISIGLAQVIR